MGEVRESSVRPTSESTFPFDATQFDRPKTPKSKPRASKAPKTSKAAPKPGPRVTATGHLVRDGSGLQMLPVPNFETLLADMRNNKAVMALPERTIFVGAQMLATQALVAQPGVLGTSVLSQGQGLLGPAGVAGPAVATGATSATGAAGAQ